MSSDIKSLDADMQRLVRSCCAVSMPGLAETVRVHSLGVYAQVYENYNRFITATDTIRDLKTNLDAASPSMPKLQQTSGDIILQLCIAIAVLCHATEACPVRTSPER